MPRRLFGGTTSYGAVPGTFLAAPRDAGGPFGADEVIDVTEKVNALRRAAGLL
ncbi:hypothetical protein [Streptomyces griseosporeus]|uniref:hypothetical protein n=1 Tax=Streptomyces griseosporeus TaxID=1910 RepID=UPI00167D7077|nr:hypothetical protein [Streptomyces griseosporeus]